MCHLYIWWGGSVHSGEVLTCGYINYAVLSDYFRYSECSYVSYTLASMNFTWELFMPSHPSFFSFLFLWEVLRIGQLPPEECYYVGLYSILISLYSKFSFHFVCTMVRLLCNSQHLTDKHSSCSMQLWRWSVQVCKKKKITWACKSSASLNIHDNRDYFHLVYCRCSISWACYHSCCLKA